jgi:YHS domain-containing protein
MDAVCGKVITKEDAISIIYENRQVDFCSEACKDAYLADPGKYDLDYDVVAGEVKRTREMKCRTVFEGRPYRFISEANKKKFEENPGAYVWAECPVGGEVFLRKDAAGKREYKGKTYYLGCKGCLALFDKDPEGALKAGKTAHNKACTHESGEKMQPACVKESKCPHAQKPGVCPHAKKSNTDADEAGQKECPHAKARQENREKKDRKRN